jgi:hypothetical protein
LASSAVEKPLRGGLVSRLRSKQTDLSNGRAFSSPAQLYFAPVSHFTGGHPRIVYLAFMLRNIIPLAASLTALLSTLYMYAA